MLTDNNLSYRRIGKDVLRDGLNSHKAAHCKHLKNARVEEVFRTLPSGCDGSEEGDFRLVYPVRV
jgi:hypothetical protein